MVYIHGGFLAHGSSGQGAPQVNWLRSRPSARLAAGKCLPAGAVRREIGAACARSRSSPTALVTRNLPPGSSGPPSGSLVEPSTLALAAAVGSSGGEVSMNPAATGSNIMSFVGQLAALAAANLAPLRAPDHRPAPVDTGKWEICDSWPPPCDH